MSCGSIVVHKMQVDHYGSGVFVHVFVMCLLAGEVPCNVHFDAVFLRHSCQRLSLSSR